MYSINRFKIQKHIEDSNFLLDVIKPVTNSTLHPWKSIKPGAEILLRFKENEPSVVSA